MNGCTWSQRLNIGAQMGNKSKCKEKKNFRIKEYSVHILCGFLLICFFFFVSLLQLLVMFVMYVRLSSLCNISFDISFQQYSFSVVVAVFILFSFYRMWYKRRKTSFFSTSETEKHLIRSSQIKLKKRSKKQKTNKLVENGHVNCA